MDTYELKLKLSSKKHYDVIVAGGGVAGVAAAVNIASAGYSVLVVEKSNVLGGLATIGIVNMFVPMCNGNGRQIIYGLAEKWLRMCAKESYNTIADEWKDGEPKAPTHARYTEIYSPYVFALLLMEELTRSGADLLLDCQAVYPVMEGNTCTGIITDSKSGLEMYSCTYLVDTTGDADVLRRAGVPTVAGENFYTYVGKCITLDGCKKAVEKGDVYYAYRGIAGGGINLFGDRQPADIPRWSGLSVEEVTDYLRRNQAEMLKTYRAFDKGTADIAMMPLMPQFRTTCHIKGDYSLKVSDCYRHFEDSICAINDFEHRSHLFEVPYRCLTKSGYPNMITAGRSADGTGYGWDLLRVIPPAILMGQAAGEACVLALRSGCNLNTVSVKTLQEELSKQNVMIHFPDEYIPEDRTVVIHGKQQTEYPEGHIE